MGMVRFEEWLEDEGQQGSAALLRYYKDVHAQAQLMDEVRVSLDPSLQLKYRP